MWMKAEGLLRKQIEKQFVAYPRYPVSTRDNSQVCINFDNGSGRCDVFVKDGTRAILITAEGVRFPVRNITVAAD